VFEYLKTITETLNRILCSLKLFIYDVYSFVFSKQLRLPNIIHNKIDKQKSLDHFEVKNHAVIKVINNLFS